MGNLLMTYKDELTKQMQELAKNSMVRFLGYNTRYGHQFNSTLKGCEESCIEMPVAENLIMGVAMGMSLEGYRPVVCIERMDFLWVCADAIVNHLDKARKLGWPPLNVIIRTCVGCNTPLDPGVQHQGDYYGIWETLLDEVVVTNLLVPAEIAPTYEAAIKHEGPVMVVEYRDKYAVPHSSHGVK